jgi:hypothetical protein
MKSKIFSFIGIIILLLVLNVFFNIMSTPSLIVVNMMFVILFFIIINFLSLTDGDKNTDRDKKKVTVTVIDFLYPKESTIIPNELSQGMITKKIKQMNDYIFNMKCDISKSYISKSGGSNRSSSIIGIIINSIGNVIGFKGFNMSDFQNYIFKYNCDIITEILQSDVANTILKNFEENYQLITKIVMAPLIFIIIPIIYFISSYFILFKEIFCKTFSEANGQNDLFDNFLFKIIFGYFNLLIMSFFIIPSIFSIKTLIHMFTFTILPFLIFKKDYIFNFEDNEKKIKGIITFISLMFIFFNIPFLYNSILRLYNI